jgi:iron complex outermembrane receptor protein
VVKLAEFTVSTSSADRYMANDAISAVRVRAALLDTPSSITVLTRDLIDDIAPTRVFDVTRYAAGVQEGRGMQFQDRMIIRGFETQNGARTVDNFLQSVDADNIDQEVVDRIEIVKGPNAILSPAGAPGGSLNIITKSPMFRTNRSITALVGMWDAQKVSLDMTGAIAPGSAFAYRLVGAYQDTRQYWSADARTRGKVVAPMLTWKLSPRTQITAKLIATEHWIFREPLLILDPNTTADTADPQIAPGLSPRGLNGIQPWSSVRTHSADLFVTATSALNEHLSLRVAGNGRYYFEDDVQEFLGTPGLGNRYNPLTGELTQDYTWSYNATTKTATSTFSPFFNPHAIPVRGQQQWTRRKTVGLQADLAANYQFGPASSQTVMGLANARQTGTNRVKDPGLLPPVDLSNPVSVYPAFHATDDQNNGNAYTNFQAYLNERLGLFNDRLFLMAGVLRYSTNTQTWNNLTPTAAHNILNDSRNMTSASILGKVLPNVSLYYSHSNNSSPVIANNAPLWRSGEQDEAGFKTEFMDHRLSVTGAYFKIAQTNVTVPNPAYQTDTTQPQTLVSDLKNHGYELEMLGRLTNELSVIATYSYLHMRDSLGRPVRAVADDTASVLGSYRFASGPAKGLSVNAGVSYVGRRPGDIPAVNFTPAGVIAKVSFYLKPQYLTRVGLTYDWQDKYVLRLIVDNVLDDRDYLSIAGGRVSGVGITTQPGMNVRFSATTKF